MIFRAQVTLYGKLPAFIGVYARVQYARKKKRITTAFFMLDCNFIRVELRKLSTQKVAPHQHCVTTLFNFNFNRCP